jgi:hypothetical protein
MASLTRMSSGSLHVIAEMMHVSILCADAAIAHSSFHVSKI